MDEPPLFTFGVIADIQYADIDDGYNFTQTRRRYYRSSLALLTNAATTWSESAVKPEFILQLGDIIDGFNKGCDSSDRALDAVLTAFRCGLLEVHHVWGNHEFYNFSRAALLRSRLNSAVHTGRCLSQIPADRQLYAYHFSPCPGFRFVVLDAYDVSLLGRETSSRQYSDAMAVIKQHNNNEDLNCPPGSLHLQHLHHLIAFTMKTLTVTALLCAIMALTTAAALPGEMPGQEPKAHPVVKPSAYCPEHWSQMYGRCFRFIQTPMTWAKAEKNCLSLGGNLASVHNIRDYQYIQRLTSVFLLPPTWIGGSDAQEETEWFWSDGTRFDYTMWNPGEPNNQSGEQHCIQMNFGGQMNWDDVECSTQLPSVCARVI